MPAAPHYRLEPTAGAALELLVGLYAATTPGERYTRSWVPRRERWSPELAAAVAAVGDRSGEAWLHLLGLALELPHGDAAGFADAVARLPQRELRRHLVGVYVPAWAALVGVDALERAAAGQEDAIERVLSHPRYYAGRARESLAPLLALPARETKSRLTTALRRFAEEAFAPQEAEVVARLRDEAASATDLARTLNPPDVVAHVTGGYVYEPEPELERVVLVPHLAARPALLLCQHRSARVICYPVAAEIADPETALAERAVSVGRALGDERRVRILRRLATGDASLDELAESLGLARSTAHHHLALLRAAGLVTLGGNAKGYWYSLRHDGLRAARHVLEGLERAPGERSARPRRRG